MADTTGLGQFLAAFPKSYFPKGAQVADGENCCNQVFYLESGLVKQYGISQSGAVFTTHLFRPGAIFPPTALTETELSSSYFEAFTSSSVRVIPLPVFTEYLRSNSEALMDYVNKLSAYFGIVSRRLNLLTGYSARQRTAAALLYLGERIGRTLDGNGQVVIDEILTHKDLGTWIGTTRETTSIQMKNLQKKGLISYHDRKIIIKNWNDLLQESGQ